MFQNKVERILRVSCTPTTHCHPIWLCNQQIFDLKLNSEIEEGVLAFRMMKLEKNLLPKQPLPCRGTQKTLYCTNHRIRVR